MDMKDADFVNGFISAFQYVGQVAWNGIIFLLCDVLGNMQKLDLRPSDLILKHE